VQQTDKTTDINQTNIKNWKRNDYRQLKKENIKSIFNLKKRGMIK
jgi:hypothetical protein